MAKSKPKTKPTFDQQLSLWIAAAEAHEAAHGELPAIVGVEMYEYFGEWVRIIEAGFRVTVEGRYGDRAEVEMSELSLRKLRAARPVSERP